MNEIVREREKKKEKGMDKWMNEIQKGRIDGEEREGEFQLLTTK